MAFMRIVAGELKGLVLTQTVSKTTRPTSDMVRESIFNILSNRIDFENIQVADLYAGTGALGIESFSRGASEVTFIETDKQACETIKKNIEKVEERIPGSTKKLNVLRTPVLTFVQDPKVAFNFDLVLCDPPYDNDVEVEIVSIAKSGGYIVYETTSKKLEDCEKEIAGNKKIEEVIVSRKIGSAGVVVARVI